MVKEYVKMNQRIIPLVPLPNEEFLKFLLIKVYLLSCTYGRMSTTMIDRKDVFMLVGLFCGDCKDTAIRGLYNIACIHPAYLPFCGFYKSRLFHSIDKHNFFPVMRFPNYTGEFAIFIIFP